MTVTIEQLREWIGSNVIVSDLWGFGYKFYKARLIAVEVHYYKDSYRIYLNLDWQEKYAPIIHKTFEILPENNNRNVYRPT